MMKKRVVALTTAAVMALSMTACGGGGGADKTASGDKEGGLSGEITVWMELGRRFEEVLYDVLHYQRYYPTD